MIFGGMKVIERRVLLDCLTLAGLTAVAATDPSSKWNLFVLLASSLLPVVTTEEWTHRWPITMPMLPFLSLQALRRVQATMSHVWLGRIINAFSFGTILLSASFATLFPPLELPKIDGPYGVGIVEGFLPIETSQGQQHIYTRVLYPTLDKSGVKAPYLARRTAAQVCRQSMKFIAPGPLKSLGWFLHTWRLVKIRAFQNATLLPGSERLPVIIYSHGLGGTAELYTYQTLAMATSGFIVLVLNHMDGSAPVVRRYDGSELTLNYGVVDLWRQGHKVEYARARRAQNKVRAEETIGATEAFLRWDKEDPDPKEWKGFSLRNRMQTGCTFFMGHSFGGATVLSAAFQRPDLVHTVLAHEPAVDWMNDDSRQSLFAEDRLKGLHNPPIGTGGYADVRGEDKSKPSIHELNILILFSEEWRKHNFGFCNFLDDMNKAGTLGSPNSLHEFGFIEGTKHMEFSDSCILTPLWLARGVGVTGTRNPLDTAKEIRQRTLAFAEKVAKVTGTKKPIKP